MSTMPTGGPRRSGGWSRPGRTYGPSRWTSPTMGDQGPEGAARSTPRRRPRGERRWDQGHRLTDGTTRGRRDMRALVYDGVGGRAWTDVPDAAIKDPEDALVRVDAVTICGTDLHILKGDLPDVQPGRV